MNELAKPAFPKHPGIHVETEGEFTGWRTWTRDSFETHTGPFWQRIDENGQVSRSGSKRSTSTASTTSMAAAS